MRIARDSTLHPHCLELYTLCMRACQAEAVAKYGVEGLDVYTSTFVNMFYTLWDVRMGGVTIARAIALLTTPPPLLCMGLCLLFPRCLRTSPRRT
jgi:hypothetical protein